ncbi:MAG: hypothetical protein MUO31_06790 [Thermodesulfovibrionales bacterium]|nr:hypothetical protein [Thermodesulfovibrionales bacterium]
MRDRYDGYLEASADWNPGDLATADITSTTVTVGGAQVGDLAVASLSTDIVDLILDAQVTAANTVTCILHNQTGGNINIGASVIKVKVF